MDANTVIADLIDALDMIRRETEKDDCSRFYISGVVKGATARCNAHRERNSDGYLALKSDCLTCDGYVLHPSEAPYCPSCARERSAK